VYEKVNDSAVKVYRWPVCDRGGLAEMKETRYEKVGDTQFRLRWDNNECN